MNKRWPAAFGLAATAWYARDTLRHRRESGQGFDVGERTALDSETFRRVSEATTHAPLETARDIELLVNGVEIFPALLDTIARAKHSLNLATYAYWSGQIAEEVAAALCERAEAGVKCNVLLDAFGSSQIDDALEDRLRRSGVQVVYFRPLKPYALNRVNNRLHRRILVADGRVGSTGGAGIADEWTGNAQDSDHWRDSQVRLRGPAVRMLQGAFAENWLEATGELLTGDSYFPHIDEPAEGAPIQLLRSSAGVGDTTLEVLYYMVIASARRTLNVTTGYFAPRRAFVCALAEAAERGVDVRLLLPGPRIDKRMVRQAGRSRYAALLGAGVRIFEYQPTMLHAKSVTADGVWSSLGSANFDNRSFQLNDEATLCVFDGDFARRLDDAFVHDLSRAHEITLRAWRRRPLTDRFQENLTKVVQREL